MSEARIYKPGKRAPRKPRTLRDIRNDPRVREVWSEGEEGYWATLQPGWWCPSADAPSCHEMTVAELASAIDGLSFDEDLFQVKIREYGLTEADEPEPAPQPPRIAYEKGAPMLHVYEHAHRQDIHDVWEIPRWQIIIRAGYTLSSMGPKQGTIVDQNDRNFLQRIYRRNLDRDWSEIAVNAAWIHADDTEALRDVIGSIVRHIRWVIECSIRNTLDNTYLRRDLYPKRDAEVAELRAQLDHGTVEVYIVPAREEVTEDRLIDVIPLNPEAG